MVPRPKDAGGAYGLYFYALLNEWHFLTGQVVFLVDGRSVEVAAETPADREVVSGRTVRESFAITLTEQIYDQLCSARTVELRLNGERGHIDGQFRPAHFAQMIRVKEMAATLAPSTP